MLPEKIGVPGVLGWQQFHNDKEEFTLKYAVAGFGHDLAQFVESYIQGLRATLYEDINIGLASDWELDPAREIRVRIIEKLNVPKHIVIDVHFTKFKNDLSVSFKRWRVLGPLEQSLNQVRSVNNIKEILRVLIILALAAYGNYYLFKGRRMSLQKISDFVLPAIGNVAALCIAGPMTYHFLGLVLPFSTEPPSIESTSHENEKASSLFSIVNNTLMKSLADASYNARQV